MDFQRPPLSKIRQNQEIDEIKRRNGIYVENQKFIESHNEILRRKAVVDCFDCYERMPNRDILEMCLGRDIFQVRGLVRTPQSKRVYARCYRSENCGKHFSNHFLTFSNIFALKQLPGIF